jgi:hypothetical protein
LSMLAQGLFTLCLRMRCRAIFAATRRERASWGATLRRFPRLDARS